MAATRQAAVVLVVAAAHACAGGDDAAPCEGSPPLGPSAVAAQMPAELVAVPGDDVTLLVWDVPDFVAGAATLHARCVGPDGAAVAPDAVLQLAAYASSFQAASRDDGSFAVVLAQWDATAGTDPKSIHLVDVDCGRGWSTPRLVRPAEPDVYVASVVTAGDAVAFSHTTAFGNELAFARGGELTSITIAPEYGSAILAASGDSIAAAWADDAGAQYFAIYGLDGALRAGPLQMPGLVGDLCWDGGEWAAALIHRDELAIAWFRPTGEPGLSVVVSTDPRAFSPGIACERGWVTAAWQRNTGGSVPGQDLVEAVITLAQVAPDATVVSTVDVEPPSGRLSMDPVVARGDRVVVSWPSYGDNGYEQRIAASSVCR